MISYLHCLTPSSSYFSSLLRLRPMLIWDRFSVSCGWFHSAHQLHCLRTSMFHPNSWYVHICIHIFCWTLTYLTIPACRGTNHPRMCHWMDGRAIGHLRGYWPLRELHEPYGSSWMQQRNLPQRQDSLPHLLLDRKQLCLRRGPNRSAITVPQLRRQRSLLHFASRRDLREGLRVQRVGLREPGDLQHLRWTQLQPCGCDHPGVAWRSRSGYHQCNFLVADDRGCAVGRCPAPAIVLGESNSSQLNIIFVEEEEEADQ